MNTTKRPERLGLTARASFENLGPGKHRAGLAEGQFLSVRLFGLFRAAIAELTTERIKRKSMNQHIHNSLQRRIAPAGQAETGLKAWLGESLGSYKSSTMF